MKYKIIQLKFAVRCTVCNSYIEMQKECVRVEGKYKISKGTFHKECFSEWCEGGKRLVDPTYKKDIAAD